jgi:hypothetical protein
MTEATASQHLAHRPQHAVALEDARGNLIRAIAALRAAASLDPDTARRVAGIHVTLVDALGELQSSPGRPHPLRSGDCFVPNHCAGLPSRSQAQSGRPGDSSLSTTGNASP